MKISQNQQAITTLSDWKARWFWARSIHYRTGKCAPTLPIIQLRQHASREKKSAKINFILGK